MTRTKLNEAKTILQANGWTHTLSSPGNKATGEYGLLFIKRDGDNVRKVWLNIDTLSGILAQS